MSMWQEQSYKQSWSQSSATQSCTVSSLEDRAGGPLHIGVTSHYRVQPRKPGVLSLLSVREDSDLQALRRGKGCFPCRGAWIRSSSPD